MTKLVFDKVLALFLIAIFLPIYIIVAILILLRMGRPILFKQKRPGLHGKIFEIYKFRTMTNEVDKGGQLLPDERRLVGIGKIIRSLSLDELPQIVNVLKGDMSFVGPRPLLTEYIPLYNEKQNKRHNVRPGITGWAQINGRNTLSWKEKFEYDIWYVENQSFLFDMKILWLTFIRVINRSGITPDESVTMEPFKGNKDE